VVINLRPSEPGEGYVFEDSIRGGVIPREYISSVDAGLQSSLENGPLAGFPLVDVAVDLIDGNHHDVDSSEMAFKIAGTMAMRDAARLARPVLLEPVMSVEVVTPEHYMGDVIGDLNSRRGRVGQMELRGVNQVIDAKVPLSEMFGYANDLRSALKAARPTACNSTTTSRCRAPSPRRSSNASAANDPSRCWRAAVGFRLRSCGPFHWNWATASLASHRSRP